MLVSAPAALAAQIVAVPVDTGVPRDSLDLPRLDEAALRELLLGYDLTPSERLVAIAELRRRFPSEPVLAFALNAEATTYREQWRTDEANALYARVRVEHEGRGDPALDTEIVRAIQGQAISIEMAEAMADTGPLRPLTPDSIDLDSPSNRLRREVVERFSGRLEPDIRAIVAQERYNLALEETIASGRYSDPARFLALIAEYEDSDHPLIRRLIGDILFNLGTFAGDDRERAAYYDEFLRRYGTSDDPVIESRIYDAHANKVYALEQLGDREAAARAQAEQDAWFERQLRR